MSTNWMEEAQAACGGICPDPAAHKLHTDGRHMSEACPHCGGSEPLATPKAGDRVNFRAMRGPWGSDMTSVVIPGTVTRVWDKPNAPYVTIKTDDEHVFVRQTTSVAVIPSGETS